MIDQQTKQRIYDAAQILEVVSDFVSLKRSGANYLGLCPFHSDRKPSFYVSPAKNVCKCFSCGEGGSPLNFIMKHENMSYSEALRYLAKKYHIEIVEREETDEEKAEANERQSLFLVNEYAKQFFARQLKDTEDGQAIGLSYFRERGIRPETIEAYDLGYSPENKSALTDAALEAGYTLERLSTLGLSIKDEEGKRPPIDRFRGRVIFPVRNLSGHYVAFGGRALHKEAKAKYLNSPESPIYSKSRELYGLYQAKQAIARSGKCYLVEGYTDVLSMYQSGINNVVSSSGTALTLEQIRLLHRFTNHITVLYDGDAAGIKAALRGIDLLLEEGLTIKVVLLPNGEDPDSYARSHSSEELLAFLEANEKDFIHFKIELYREDMERDPLRRAELIRDIITSIALIPDNITREVLVQSTATMLRMDETLLLSEVAKLRSSGIRAGGYIPRSADPPQPHYRGAGSTLAANTLPSPAPQTSQEQSLSTEPTPATKESTLTHPPAHAPHHYEQSLLRLLIEQGGDKILVAEWEQAKEAIEGEAKSIAPANESQQVLRLYNVAEYVYKELELDHILGRLSPICYDVLLEAQQHCSEGQLDSISYFVNHTNDTVRRIATDLVGADLLRASITDQDPMEGFLLADISAAQDPDRQTQAIQALEAYKQEREEHRLLERGRFTQRELDNLRFALIQQEIREVQQEIREAQRSGATEQLNELISILQDLNQLKTEFALNLGERTISG